MYPHYSELLVWSGDGGDGGGGGGAMGATAVAATAEAAAAALQPISWLPIRSESSMTAGD